MLSYLGQSDQPKGFVRDLLMEPAAFELSDLGLTQARTDQLAAIQQQGRVLPQEAATNRTVDVNIDNLTAAEYQVQTYAVDTSYGNAYRARQSIQDQFDAVSGNPTALAQLVDELRVTYGRASTDVETRTITTTGGLATV